MESENETFDEVLRCMQNDIVHFVGKPVKHSRDLLQEYHDRFKAAHQREVAGLKSKMNDVVCENEALRDACGTCGAKLEVAELERKVAELRECLKMAVVNARIARTCYAFGRECDNCGQSCNARKWNKVIEVTKGAEDEGKRDD